MAASSAGPKYEYDINNDKDKPADTLKVGIKITSKKLANGKTEQTITKVYTLKGGKTT